MTNTVVVGTQWGDEGKAKIIDYLAKSHDIVIRFHGGTNAGHTTKANGIDFIFHLMPAGALYPGKICVVSNGVVFNIDEFLAEVGQLEEKGITDIRERLYISDSAHLIMPYHISVDKGKASKKIGTTGRGIGPAYMDKAARTGIRVGDAFDLDFLEQMLSENNLVPTSEIKNIAKRYNDFVLAFKSNIVDTSYLLNEYITNQKKLLFEGAQGTFLDIDHGTYPYVTSSNSVAGNASVGSGVGPNHLNKILGVVKAYTTRVGEGPFTTELGNYDEAKVETKLSSNEIISLLSKINSGNASDYEIGAYLRAKGGEYGATTGRPRRAGWHDTVLLNKAKNVNGLDAIAITKLDVFSGLNELKICTAYEIDGARTTKVPTNIRTLARTKPIYETLPGWKEDISDIRDYSKLPENAKQYVQRIKTLADIDKVDIVSVGPDRKQTIVL